MARYFHVSSSLNRESILTCGLDWERMGAAPGLAGSRRPEQQGCFLCRDEWGAEWIVDMNNTDGPVDVWAVDGVAEDSLVESGEGFFYVPFVIGPEHIVLLHRDIGPVQRNGGWRWPTRPRPD
jgi:hypothetical protein